MGSEMCIRDSHNLTLSTQGIIDNSVSLSVIGQRVKKSVSNTLTVTQFTRKRKTNKLTFNVTDSAHDVRIGGKSYLHITVVEDKIFGRNVIKEANKRVIQLDANGRASVSIDAVMDKSKRKLSIKYSIERKGSAYFQDNRSRNGQTSKLKRK